MKKNNKEAKINQENSVDVKDSHALVKYIVPPGLQVPFYDYLNHHKVSGDAPIMIVGETGVGKSMFLHISQKLFEEENSGSPVCWANCSHFEGNLARSELFGHVKGAYTDAKKDKKGIIEVADGGLLILEEIGELSFEVQAMLLTFIETGQYRRVGDSEIRNAKVKIIGATNNEEALRDDFKYRFVPFYVPSLYQRRNDVLYYMCYSFPELLESLTMNEVLAILAYHWPGNVREIERVVFLMQKERLNLNEIEFESEADKSRFESFRLMHTDKRYTFLDTRDTENIYYGVKYFDGDVVLLEKLLNKLKVGLANDKVKYAFKKIPNIKEDIDQFLEPGVISPYRQIIEDFNVHLVIPMEEFNQAYEGFLAFCSLFGQDPFKRKNILSDIKNGQSKYFDLARLDYPKSKKAAIENLLKAIMRYLNGMYVPGYKYPKDPFEYWSVLRKQKEEYNFKNDKEKRRHKSFDDIWSMKEDELRKIYYEGLLERTGRNVKSASRIAGVVETTFRDRLKKVGVQFKRFGTDKQ